MFYITGDTHGNFQDVAKWCKPTKRNIGTTLDDYLIILGDSGINYYLDFNAKGIKRFLAKLPLNFIIIHGNHEERASFIPTYSRKYIKNDNIGLEGSFLVEPEYPNLLFTEMYGRYIFNHQSCYVIGGGYSVDKYFRLEHKYNWYESEQLSTLEKYEVWHELRNLEDSHVDIKYILSHTCPAKYIPTEWFLPQVDQSTVDNSMEEFFDMIDNYIPYTKWYCGHYHGEKETGTIEFMYHSIKEFE